MKTKKSKILIVDDEISICRILATHLSMAGDEVLAADGLEALDIFSSEVPDLIVLDAMLPKLDGYSVCQMNIPITMLGVLTDAVSCLLVAISVR